jgi:hypothetical protein
MNKLTSSDKHLLSLVSKGQKPDGWTTVSNTVMKVMVPLAKTFPELVTLEEVGTGGIAKLTREGEIVLKWL